MKCPNCGFTDAQRGLMHPSHRNGCVLLALAEVVQDRGVKVDEAKLAEVDSDWLWSRLGPLTDDLEEQIKAEREPIAA